MTSAAENCTITSEVDVRVPSTARSFTWLNDTGGNAGAADEAAAGLGVRAGRSGVGATVRAAGVTTAAPGSLGAGGAESTTAGVVSAGWSNAAGPLDMDSHTAQASAAVAPAVSHNE
jgi:hypothetical protein